MASVPVTPPRRALLSVTDKTGLGEVAGALHGCGYELIASGGTARFLRERHLPVTGVSDLTGYPEVFGGRVKTLHPSVHGGILGPDRESFQAVADLGIAPIDVVVVNLYRFAAAAAGGGPEAGIVEQIDVGGPALLRAGAKNFQRVTVVGSPAQYDEFLAELAAHGGTTSLDFRRRMAASAFGLTAQYDRAVARWFTGGVDPGDAVTARRLTLRYGENPHQAAYVQLPPQDAAATDLSCLGLTQHGGKELSYNNIVDLVAALKLVGDFAEPCCAVVKHTNPCGLGLGGGAGGLQRALACDPVSAFGGVFAFNHAVDMAAAEVLAGRFLEIVAAPAFEPGALTLLTRKKNVRVIQADPVVFADATRSRSRGWGRLLLIQDEDEGFPELETWKVAAGREPEAQLRAALVMAWKVCKHGKSNAVVLCGLDATLGLGFGQMSRVDAAELAITKARQQGLDLSGCVAASDGFFPFPDGLEKLAAAGVRAVIAPGGSIRDLEVAAAAQALGLTLILTDRRHFHH